MATYKVKDGWQVKHNGKIHHGGDTLEGVRNADALKYLSAGWVEEVKETESKPSAKKTTSKGESHALGSSR